LHQFKEKSGQERNFVSAGLFIYPIMQAADILGYQTDEVPVRECCLPLRDGSANLARGRELAPSTQSPTASRQ
jgi:hypothetical protein